MDDQDTQLTVSDNLPTEPNINIDDEMKSSYLEYAMSVIVGRALPDVRDGLKPVHRRILYSMYEQGYTASRPYKKCARIVGDVLGRYHPHGDSAVYDSLVRMAQDFSLRYMLIDGQGNYGSIDGDNAAAMRYTEARMEKLSMSLLQDIEKETVQFANNFDESLEEPTVLPTRIPTLLLNGSSGIAVGMATNIPPHNLNELMDGIEALIDNPEIETAELMTHIKGPDFPTGGTICGQAGIVSAYETGRGVITVRAKTRFEENKKRNVIIVDEIPYMVNKANLIIKIAELVNDKKITGISDLRDESDRKGLRIYIELKRDAQQEIVLNQLFKHTSLQSSFGINMVAIVKGIPQTLNLKQVLTHYIEHRKEIVTKRTEYDLKIAKARLHILEGLKIALDNIDAVIALIKKSKDTASARAGLMDTFKLSEKQANAILEMRLQRLTGLEREKIENEYNEILTKIADLEDILANTSRIYQIIKDEHQEIKEKFGDERRSEISGEIHNVNIEDLIPEQKVAILMTKNGIVKRMPVSAFRSQLRGGRGVSGISTREEDMIDKLLVTSSHDFILAFTSTGKVHKFKAYQIPESSRQSKGASISHFLELKEDETITTLIPVTTFNSDENLIMTTKKGIIKKTEVAAFSHFKTRAIIAINLDPNDQLSWVHKSTGNKDIILTTSAGMVIRFKEELIRTLGRASRGVRAIKIKNEDELMSMDLIDPEDQKLFLLLLTRKGFGKNLKVNEFKCQNRGGIGVHALKFRKTVNGDRVNGAIIASTEDELMIVTKSGTLCRQKISNISIQRRASQGVKVVKLDDSDEVIAIAKVLKETEEEVVVEEKKE
ncbi:DNA gyrase subunit A [Candidatus Marinamargulisbacteria bacterium SCGC AG-439-L15]|nr:DNA gyrase subunit A [Candidatus Marinamargulisbacteria bacterium SCGC AG-439-L15]